MPSGPSLPRRPSRNDVESRSSRSQSSYSCRNFVTHSTVNFDKVVDQELEITKEQTLQRCDSNVDSDIDQLSGCEGSDEIVAVSKLHHEDKKGRHSQLVLGHSRHCDPGNYDAVLPRGAFPATFHSLPEPPHGLWDTDNVQFLDKVEAKVWIRLTHIEPKDGRFEGRMKFHWFYRVLNTKDRTEPRKRIPGVRMPRLACEVEESRVWRHFDGDTDTTVAWKGITVLSFHGYEIFEVYDFPFDRQVIDFDLFEFVWKDDKDSDTFYESMKVVSFTTETVSMMPDWDCYPAIVEPVHVQRPGSGPSFVCRFTVKARIQRRAKYYITQIFMVTWLITSASLFPLALMPGKRYIGDRIALQSSALLTLVSFKYSVSQEMPSVPYATFASTFLTLQIYTVVASSIETIIGYKLCTGAGGGPGVMSEASLGLYEDFMMIGGLLFWLCYFLYVAFFKRRQSWNDVLDSQNVLQQVQEYKAGTTFMPGNFILQKPHKAKMNKHATITVTDAIVKAVTLQRRLKPVAKDDRLAKNAKPVPNKPRTPRSAAVPQL